MLPNHSLLADRSAEQDTGEIQCIIETKLSEEKLQAYLQ